MSILTCLVWGAPRPSHVLENPTSDEARVQANSNQAAAGALAAGVLTVNLEVREAEWFPEDDNGPSLKVFAFAERGKPSQIPGPLIRVPEGTTIHACVHNFLSRNIVLHGLHGHPGRTEDVLEVPAGETRQASFMAGAPGTYSYWASAGGDTWNSRPYKEDALLSGGFIVDEAGNVPRDRIFVIGVWRDKQRPDESLDIPIINGKSWPYTERLEYVAGTEVRWRWLNLSGQIHPMHLHGSYFRVDSLGDGERDEALPPPLRKSVVTQTLPIGGTMATFWVPQRAGRWLFHCHILAHISPDIAMFHHQEANGHETMGQHDPLKHMSGMVMGITVVPRPGERTHSQRQKPKRKLQLLVAKQPGSAVAKGYALVERGKPNSKVSVPGPTIVLTRGEPVAIRVTNQLDEPTAVHWHGMELESYYDGVAGWTGDGESVTPLIQPGRSFDVHFTPPRAGTFIYHTHMKDLLQLSSGLYGPLIVVAPGESFHADTDKIFVIGRNGKRRDGQLLLNGETRPGPLEWQAGAQYRLRFINISANNTMDVSLSRSGALVSWKAVAKDGADLPPEQAVTCVATFAMSPGETYDFVVQSEANGPMELTIENRLFKEEISQAIEVEAARGK